MAVRVRDHRGVDYGGVRRLRHGGGGERLSGGRLGAGGCVVREHDQCKAGRGNVDCAGLRGGVALHSLHLLIAKQTSVSFELTTEGLLHQSLATSGQNSQ